MIKGVDHIAIAARDSRALVSWYCDRLGMQVLFDNGEEPPCCLVGGTMGGVLEIMPGNGKAGVTHEPLDPGLRHIALRVDDFQEAYDWLKSRVDDLTEPGPAAGGGQIAFFSDSEGNLLQIVSRDAELL